MKKNVYIVSVEFPLEEKRIFGGVGVAVVNFAEALAFYRPELNITVITRDDQVPEGVKKKEKINLLTFSQIFGENIEVQGYTKELLDAVTQHFIDISKTVDPTSVIIHFQSQGWGPCIKKLRPIGFDIRYTIHMSYLNLFLLAQKPESQNYMMLYYGEKPTVFKKIKQTAKKLLISDHSIKIFVYISQFVFWHISLPYRLKNKNTFFRNLSFLINEGLIQRYASKMYVVSSFQLSIYQKYSSLKNTKKIEVLLNGLNSNRHVGTDSDFNSEIISQLDSLKQKNNKIMLSISRIAYEKGIHYLVEALKILDSEQPGLSVIIAGKFENNDYCRGIKKELGKISNIPIYLPGHISGLNKHFALSESNFYMCSSLSESFGLSIIEGMMYGLPVISSRCGGPEEIVKEPFGILVDYSIPSTRALLIAEGIRKMLNSDLNKMGDEALKESKTYCIYSNYYQNRMLNY